MEDFVGPPPLGLGERGNLHEGPNLVTTEFFRIFIIDFNGSRIRPKKILNYISWSAFRFPELGK